MFHFVSPLPTRRDFVRTLALAGPSAVPVGRALTTEAAAQVTKPAAPSAGVTDALHSPRRTGQPVKMS